MTRNSFLLELYAVLILIALYGACDFYLSLWLVETFSLSGNVYGWVIFLGFLSPLIVYWAVKVSTRTKNYLALLKGRAKPFVWNIEKTVEEWLDMIKPKRKKDE